MATVQSTLPALGTPLIVALVAMKGYEENQKGAPIYVEDLAGYLIELKSKGVDTRSVDISGVPGKYWSEDIAEFVSEGVVFGFLEQRSPIKFTGECLEMCQKAIRYYLDHDKKIRPYLEQAKDILRLQNLDLA